MHPKTNDALTALVWDIMQWHIGQKRRLSRDMLIRRVNRIMKASDRQIRDAISELPIISTSGTGGYWLPADDAEIDEWAREMLSRTQQIYKRVRLARTWLNESRQPAKVEQLELLEVQ